MKKLRRILLLLAALSITSIPLAAHDFEVDGIYYNITSSTSQTCSVTFEGTNYSECADEYCGDIVIPNEVVYNDVTYTVSLIGNSAFKGCSNLTSITIPDSVTSIGMDAFNGCINLTEVSIPKSITGIGFDAFYRCTKLTEVRISDIAAWCNIVFQGGRENTGYYNSNPLYYAKRLILNGTEITDLVIPDTATQIGMCAFYGCTNLVSVTIPNSVTHIDDAAFSGCSGLTSIIFPSSIAKIDDAAFSGCTNLTHITIPNSVTQINEYAFSGCTGLTSITFPNSITSIPSDMLRGCTGLTRISIPNSVTYIGYRAFSGCSNLTYVTIPNSVTEIQDNAFSGTPFYMNMPQQGLIYLGKILYEYRGTMPDNTSIIIETGTVTIADEVFKNCTGLVSVTIPASMKKIGSDVFTGCSNLKELNLGANINIFDYYDLQSGKINLDRVNILNTISSLSVACLPPATEINIEDSTVPLEIPHVSNSNDYFNCEKLRIGRDISFHNDIFKEIKGLTIGKEVNSLKYDYGYYHVDSLTNLYIETSTNKLDLKLPYGCPIDSVHIGRPVTNTFANYRTLKHVTVENGVDLLPGMFAYCDSIKFMALPFAGAGTAQTVGNFGELFGTVVNSNMRAVTQLMEDGTAKTYYLPTGLKELVIGEGCEQLPYGALYNCSMIEKLTLPTTIKGVKENALYGCDGLTDLYVKRALPPSAYETSFTGVNQFGCTLHVPHNSKQYYSIANGWKYFYFIEEEAPLTVSVAKSIDNGGEILGINQYEPGATAEMEAIAHSGYTFVGWYEDGQLLTTDSKYSFTVTESHTFVAQFASLLNENNVTVTPQSEAVTLSWEQEDGASSYEIGVYSDAAMTQQVGSMEVDQSGQVMTQAATQMSVTVTGLSVSTGYYYRITAYDEAKAVLSQYTGTFSTIAGVESVTCGSNISYSVLPGMLAITCNDATTVMLADMNGRTIYNGVVSGSVELQLANGIYILRAGTGIHKIVVR